MTTEKLHILHIPGWYPTEGDPAFGIFIQKHIESVHNLNHSSVIFLQKGGVCLEVVREEPYELYAEFKVSNLPVIKPITQIVQYQQALKKAYNQLLLKKGKPDLIHFHILNAYSVVAKRFFKNRGIPYVISEQWSGYTNGLFENKSRLYKKQIHKLAQQAAGISTVSTFLKNHMQRLGLTSNPFTVIPNVVSFQNEALKAPSKKHPIRIINISDLVDQTKNISGLICAFQTVAERYEDAELHIIGKGPDMETLQLLGTELGLAKQIKWHGYVPHQDVMTFLATMSFYVCSSPYETFNVAIAEALSVGLPVVCTQCGGPEEFVNDDNGLLVPIRDTGALSNALLDMADRHSTYDSKKISAEVISNFNMKKIASQFDLFYRTALTQTRQHVE